MFGLRLPWSKNNSMSRLKIISRKALLPVFLAVAGGLLILATKAATANTRLNPADGKLTGNIAINASGSSSFVQFGSKNKLSCGRNVANYTYVRPFGPEAAWNIPACVLKKWSARSDDFVNRLANNAIRNNLGNYDNNGVRTPMTKLDFSTEFGLTDSGSAGNDYSVPIYDAKDATQQVRVFLKTTYAGYNANIGGNWIESPSYNWNATVPWNPSWRGAFGNDQGLVILDHTTGREIYLWNVSRADMPSPFNNVSECALDIADLARGYNQNVDLCAAAATIAKKYDFTDADYRTYEGNSPPANGGGIQNYAGLVTPDEVSAGEIRHAIKFVITNTMFGPACSKTLDIGDPSIGTTCGTAFAPAGQFENNRITDGKGGGSQFAPGNTPDEIRSGTVPEGTRFALNISDSEINTWLDSRGYTGRKRETARIFAVAMRDYGLIITDTSGGGTSIQTSGGMNPTTSAKWRALGIDNDGKDFLYKLFTKEKLYMLEPAINDCGDGTTSRYFCHAIKTHY